MKQSFGFLQTFGRVPAWVRAMFEGYQLSRGTLVGRALAW